MPLGSLEAGHREAGMSGSWVLTPKCWAGVIGPQRGKREVSRCLWSSGTRTCSDPGTLRARPGKSHHLPAPPPRPTSQGTCHISLACRSRDFPHGQHARLPNCSLGTPTSALPGHATSLCGPGPPLAQGLGKPPSGPRPMGHEMEPMTRAEWPEGARTGWFPGREVTGRLRGHLRKPVLSQPVLGAHARHLGDGRPCWCPAKTTWTKNMGPQS